MENSLFIFTDNVTPIEIERFHFCTWEFNNNSSLVEIGIEISKNSISGNNLTVSLFIPWFSHECKTKDLYDKLKNDENSRFIFNDSIGETKYLKDNTNSLGVIHKFSDRNELCVLPVELENIKANEHIVTAKLNLLPYLNYGVESKPNVYFRFWIEPHIPFISMRKRGISKSTIIYDIKVNEKRNIPENKVSYFSDKNFCKIKSCFLFNIIPNKYDLVFIDNASLRSIRTLEYDSFNKYLDDKRVKKDELIVVFNKKQNVESFSFFSIYAKERIGVGQFALAILINIVCGVLLFIPAYRKTFNPEISLSQVWFELPSEIFIAIGIAIATLIYFTWPFIANLLNKGWSQLVKTRTKK